MTTTEKLVLDTSTDACTIHSFRRSGKVRIEFDSAEVHLDPAALDDGGLIFAADANEHCGHDLDQAYEDGREAADEEHAHGSAKVMEEWHNDHHKGAVRFCYDEPCKALREAGL